MHRGAVEDAVLQFLGHEAVEHHQRLDPQLAGVIPQAIGPPSVADNIQAHVRVGARHGGQRVQRVLDLLVGDQPGQRHQVDRLLLAGVVGVGAGGVRNQRRRNRINAVTNDLDVAARHAKLHQLLGGGGGDGDPAAAPVDPRRDGGFDQPADAGEDRAGDGPLFAVAVMRQNNRGRAADQGGEEGHAVLRIHHNVRAANIRQGPTPPAGSQDRGQRTRVNRQVAAATRETEIAADLLRSCGAGIVGSAEHHLVALVGQVLPHALQVTFAAATFGVVCVAPAEKQYFHDGHYVSRHRLRLCRVW